MRISTVRTTWIIMISIICMLSSSYAFSSSSMPFDMLKMTQSNSATPAQPHCDMQMLETVTPHKQQDKQTIKYSGKCPKNADTCCISMCSLTSALPFSDSIALFLNSTSFHFPTETDRQYPLHISSLYRPPIA